MVLIFFCGMLSIDHRVKMLLCHVNIAKWIFLAILSRVATVREKSGNFLKRQGKSLILAKPVKSQGIPFPVYS